MFISLTLVCCHKLNNKMKCDNILREYLFRQVNKSSGSKLTASYFCCTVVQREVCVSTNKCAFFRWRHESKWAHEHYCIFVDIVQYFLQIQRLMDLPTTLETAESTPPPTAAMTAAITNPQRAKSMFPTPPLGGANKLTPGRLPPHPGPPQRSISHNEVRVITIFVLKESCWWEYYATHWQLWRESRNL